ncbi:ABC transporter ATP-binding protein [Tenacibaculum finnmarkense]|uniref:ABC-type transport system involved in resistance to organic solvents, ATPase component n=1 Tax=Tenacibaculum finnmarkense genomovar ulcerans TaxID=2781388 RepID=A0A2I2M854_9FLAO|nr:ATP-binding cassette domain-containing protein [Tenacibaculum finnmarkense]ALU75549.1 ABC transporter ATP-binding protein [Tenacibaculum dicentrarchi]MBE7632957.1 ATP-binding cassette domain-containing protein [Tenacibaculum finnmarkense genomovar ulcerans]MBE7644608.1 ATP-binding cassette domain-containing protein [Tenacibaculum finnmarkense genomovar ulcerans]MBE7687801.1 ATP-binding cassette domain-containing protein [Tenacibaculum finnmarkense genomovar ulcerans]MBE7697095.1 ATP-binding
MIEVKNLHKGFNGVEILKGISTTFLPGETSLIIGTSGSGKTVFLKSLIGLHIPESGTVTYDGLVNTAMTAAEKRNFRKEIGMVFQGSALFDSQTVEENVMFPLKMFTKQIESEMLDRVNVVLKRVNLENSNKKFPAELSGGMQKRVAIARAIVMNPKYLFCDEPNSGLDPQTATVIDNLIKEITDEYQITTIINTHDMNSVMEIGEKIVFLKNGFKEWEGSHKEIFRTDNQAVVNFVYSSNLFKKVREAYLLEK